MNYTERKTLLLNEYNELNHNLEHLSEQINETRQTMASIAGKIQLLEELEIEPIGLSSPKLTTEQTEELVQHLNANLEAINGSSDDLPITKI